MIGQMLGPYKIIEQVGAGGMATVYKAYQAAMDRFVAIKVLPPNMAQDPQFTTRFAQEARTIAKLEHPFILPVYDSGNEKGTAYIVMRYMEAGTLGDLLNKGRPDLRYSVRLIQRIAEALDYAHSQGIVHRDIKPNNILIDKNGQPYLTDFGIAKILESAGNLTGSGIIGTPSYMSPEQGQGMPVDARSDIYSLGVVLYEMVTNRLPFESTTPMGVMLKHIQEPLPPPSSIAPDVPPAIEAVITKALEKNREARYRTAGEFARALESAITGRVIHAATAAMREPSATVAVGERTVPSRPDTGSRAKPPTRPPTRAVRSSTTASDKPEEKRNSPNWFLLMGCGGLALVGVVALAIAAVFAVPGLLPTSDPNAVGLAATQTFAAAYDSAVQTAQALAANNNNNTTPLSNEATTPAPVPGATNTPTPGPQATTPTPTEAPTETPGTTGCNDNAKYVADVTIPDNTQIAANAPFTKTWRVENTGTCTWDTSYTLRFIGGVQMSGPGAVNFPVSVSPGGQMDISVNLVAPASPGSYTGQWRVTNKEGSAFGINGLPLTVVIVVPATPTITFTPTFTPTATPTIPLAPPVGSVAINPSNHGQINSEGSANPGVPNVGDVASNRALQAFLTFDLSSIPSGATILGVRLDLSSHDVLGNPFSLGCLRGYEQNYGNFDGSDFFSGTAGGALWRFCDETQLSSVDQQKADNSGIAVVQNALAAGKVQIRLQFNEQATNNNGVADVVRPTPKLIVSFTQ